MDNARQAGGGQYDRRGRWMTQDEQVVDNMGRSGGKQRKAIWRWMSRQEEGVEDTMRGYRAVDDTMREGMAML